jgi:integrase
VKREPQVLCLAELLALADAMPEKHRTLTLLSGLCGLRFGEAVALRRSDVDLAAGVVHVRQGVTRGPSAPTAARPRT